MPGPLLCSVGKRALSFTRRAATVATMIAGSTTRMSMPCLRGPEGRRARAEAPTAKPPPSLDG
jgi:hypothetical protein